MPAADAPSSPTSPADETGSVLAAAPLPAPVPSQEDIATPSHPFADELMRLPFYLLITLEHLYQGRQWPVERSQLDDVWERLGSTSKAAALFKLSRHNYLKVRQGTRLEWNHLRVSSALHHMPAKIRQDAPLAAILEVDETQLFTDFQKGFWFTFLEGPRRGFS